MLKQRKQRYFLFSIIALVVMLQPIKSIYFVEGVTVFTGIGVASTGRYVLETSIKDAKTKLTIINVSKTSDNSSLIPTKIFWNYTDYQNNHLMVWNSTSIEFSRNYTDPHIMSFNATVWINESISFWYLININRIINGDWTFNGTLIGDTPTVDAMVIILIIPMTFVYGLILKVRQRKQQS